MPAECTPHFLFALAEKKTGRARSKRKNARGGVVCRVLGKSLPAAWCGRGVGGLGHSLRRFPLALPWERRGSVSGARRAGLLMTSNVDRCSVNAGKDRFPLALP